MKTSYQVGLVFMLAGLLAACGSSSGIDAPPIDPPVAGSDIPQSATQQTPAAISFVNSTLSTSTTVADMAEPLNTGDDTVQLATSETDEPVDI
jgi:hypothetical protein